TPCDVDPSLSARFGGERLLSYSLNNCPRSASTNDSAWPRSHGLPFEGRPSFPDVFTTTVGEPQKRSTAQRISPTPQNFVASDTPASSVRPTSNSSMPASTLRDVPSRTAVTCLSGMSSLEPPPNQPFARR